MLQLTRKKVELLVDADDPSAAASAAAGGRKSKSRDSAAGKAAVVQSAPWASGVSVRFVAGSESEFVLQLAASAAPKRRPPAYTLCTSTRQQRDLLLLALAPPAARGSCTVQNATSGNTWFIHRYCFFSAVGREGQLFSCRATCFTL